MTDTGGERTGADAVFRALAEAERRRALAYLRAAEGAVPVSELATAVAARTGDDTGRTEDRTRTALYHVHVPKLAAAGLVEWVDGKRAARTTEAGESLPSAVRWFPGDAPTTG